MAWKMFCVFVSRLHRKPSCIVGMASLCAVIPGVLAAGYLERPVRVIVPSPPGGLDASSEQGPAERGAGTRLRDVTVQLARGASLSIPAPCASPGSDPKGSPLPPCDAPRLRDANVRESAAAAWMVAQASVPREHYPIRPVRVIVPSPPGGLDASSEQGSRLRDANVRESAAAAWMVAQASVPREHYPIRPVRVIVPSPPGGGTDTSTRIVTPKLSEILGQQFVVDNRGGASGNIGAEIAKHAAPDGYTLLATLSSHASNPSVMKNVPYDLERDFAPIARTVTVPNVLLSHPSLPVKTTRELIAFAKARPGQLQFATAGIGTNPHLSMELFLSMAGLKMIVVPYKGVGPALTDVIAGHVPLTTANLLVTLPHVKSGRLRAYGVTSAARSSAAPEIPTIAEAGLPGYEAVQWYGLLAPAGTPREIVTKLHAAVVQALRDPAVRQRFIDGGADPTPSSSPEEFAAVISAELKKWAKVVKDAGIKPE